MGDAFGREGKGGQAWLTYHLSPREMVQLSFQHKKNAKDFIPDGTTQNSLDLRVVKRVRRQWEIRADVQQEWWKAPVYKPGQQSDTAATFQITWFPRRRRMLPRQRHESSSLHLLKAAGILQAVGLRSSVRDIGRRRVEGTPMRALVIDPAGPAEARVIQIDRPDRF